MCSWLTPVMCELTECECVSQLNSINAVIFTQAWVFYLLTTTIDCFYPSNPQLISTLSSPAPMYLITCTCILIHFRSTLLSTFLKKTHSWWLLVPKYTLELGLELELECECMSLLNVSVWVDWMWVCESTECECVSRLNVSVWVDWMWVCELTECACKSQLNVIVWVDWMWVWRLKCHFTTFLGRGY